jgi:predicted Fe-Mo cluster-binding NifX family protein
MVLGIPLFGSRVSPHFSTAREFLVVFARENRIHTRSRLEFSKDSPAQRRRRLLAMGIDSLICGGIDNATKQWFEERKVHVIENTMGDVEKVISRYLDKGEAGITTLSSTDRRKAQRGK